MVEMNALSLGDVDGAPDRVLVKFFFTNPKHIPTGIPERGRDTDAAMDTAHAMWAKVHEMAELAKQGRIRPGRVDTGTQVIKNLPDVQVATLRRGFANSGYVLSSAHWYVNPAKEQGKQPKAVVCLTFSRVAHVNEVPDLPRKTLDALRELAKTTWQFCHVYNNPDGCATVNLMGRRWDDKNQCYFAPRNALVVRDGQLRAIEVAESVSEETE